VKNRNFYFNFCCGVAFFILLFILANPGYALTVIGDDGAIVYFNDKLVGTIKGHQLSFDAQIPGTLKLVKPGYIPFEKMITEDATVVVNLVLPAYLNIVVSPTDSTIYIDGDMIARGSTKVSLKPGEHVIKVSAPGFTEKDVNVYLNPYEEKKIDITLKNTVTLTLDTSKRIENAFLNFDKIVLPTTLEVQPGRYRLILPTNFVNYIQEIEIPAVDNYKFSVDSRQYKVLTVLGKPENATVKVGSDFYNAPGEIRLVNGKYDVQVISPGYKNFSTTILLESDQVLYYTLEPIEQIDVLLDGTNTTVEFDGFSQELLVKRLMFTTIKQMTKDSEISEESVVWFGFSDGTLKDIPKSIPVALSQGIQVAINGIVHSGPTVIQVPSKQVIRVLRGANSEELIAEKPLVLDSAESCLVNIFSRSVLDVFVNGTYIGRTPIYLANLPKGTYTFVFKKGESELYKEDVYIENGKINEIRVDK